MTKEEKIEYLSQLGFVFEDLLSLMSYEVSAEKSKISDKLLELGIEAIRKAELENAWFTFSSIEHTFQAWKKALKKEKVEKWLQSYQLKESSGEKVGLILAGNIPLVGLHDILSVLISGGIAHVKCSSKDKSLMIWVLEVLADLSEEWKERIILKERLNEIDTLIATGSDNSARHFEYYFKDRRRLIRKNRTSVAVIGGNETEKEMEALADDVFRYFGLGCRNVTKVFVPKDYDLDLLFKAFFKYKELINHHKYANNYDYNKAVYLLNQVDLLENGFLLLKEGQDLHSPIAVLFYEYYNDLPEAIEKIEENKDQIQCKVGNISANGFTPFGEAQEPELWDYADGVDTLKFLLNN